MQGKTVVITGATSGIGEVAATRLAGMGARIVFVARDTNRGEATLRRLNSAAPGLHHRVHYADLSNLSEMKRVAEDIAVSQPRIDVLMNNAGAIFDRRYETEDRLERTFALNHMSYFIVTRILRERLLATPGARIINTASDAHRNAKAEFDDLQLTHGYSALKAYCKSKLYNILFTRELAHRLAGSGVTANSLHPGFVATRFSDEGKGLVVAGFRFLKRFAAITPERGAETLIFLASATEVASTSGEYFHKSARSTPTRAAQDDAAAKRLWAESERIAARLNL